MRLFFYILLPLLLACQASPVLAAARVECGEYSFELPEGFELRTIREESSRYDKILILNEPFIQKELTSATITCYREKKTEFQSFSLPHKEKINLQVGARKYTQMLLTATENARQDSTWVKFSLLEERTTNSREIRGRERFMVAIEMDASSDDSHTLLFVSDFRSFDGFFDTDEFKSQVTGVATQVMESLKKVLP